MAATRPRSAPTRSRWRALKPFAVLDDAASINSPPVGGGAVFEQALENAGVPLVISTGANEPGGLSRSYAAPTAEFIGKQLEGGKAEYADESMQDQPRKFGVIYPNNFDIDYLKEQLAKYGVTLASEAEFTVPPGEVSLQTTSPEIDQQIPPLGREAQGRRRQQPHRDGVARRHDRGDEGDEGPGLVPRDHCDGVPLHRPRRPRAPLRPGRVVARVRVDLVPARRRGRRAVAEPRDVPVVLGHRQGHEVGRCERAARAALHADPFRGADPHREEPSTRSPPGCARRSRAWAARTATAGSPSRRPPPPPEGGTPIRGTALGWWDPNDEGAGNYNLGVQGKGQYQYLDDAKRYVVGTFPKAKKKFFDPSNSTLSSQRSRLPSPTWPDVPVRRLPEQRQHHDHARDWGSGLRPERRRTELDRGVPLRLARRAVGAAAGAARRGHRAPGGDPGGRSGHARRRRASSPGARGHSPTGTSLEPKTSCTRCCRRSPRCSTSA